MDKITLCDGKYTITCDNGYKLKAYRYGEQWRDLVGDNLVLAMFERILELESRVVNLPEVRELEFNSNDNPYNGEICLCSGCFFDSEELLVRLKEAGIKYE